MSLARLTLVLSLSLVGLAADECQQDDGCGLFGCVSQPQPGTEPKPKPKQDDGCPPPVPFMTVSSGTVVDVRDCPGLFNTGIRYARVKGTDSGIGSRTVWTSNGAGCQVGSDWSEISGC